MATKRDPDGVFDDSVDSDDEATLADEEWPVADLYRVEPLDEPIARDDEAGALVVEQPAEQSRGFRRFPEAVGPGTVTAVLALLVLVLLIPAGLWLAARADDDTLATEGAEAAGSASQPATVAPATTAPSVPSAPSAQAVPDLVGTTLAQAREELESAGLRVRFERVDSDRPRNEVLRQEPEAGADTEPRSIVVLTVSGGEARVAVPNVEGMSVNGAVRAIRDAGLEPSTRRTASDEPPGTVLEQEPAAGEEVSAGMTVALRIAAERATQPAAEPAAVRVPALVGTRSADARSRLQALGLRWTQRPMESSRPAGEVVSQSPAANAELRKGGTVTLHVSSGPAGVAVPDVVGLDESAAVGELEAAGFAVLVVDEATLDPGQIGIVLRQSPSGGTTRDEGGTVTITVARSS